MRITFILPGIISLSGGSRVVFEYANRLTEKGHDVTVIYALLPLNIVPGPLVETTKANLGAIKRIFTGNPIKWFDLKAKLIRVPSLGMSTIGLVERLIPDADAIVATAWETAYPVSRLGPRKGKKFYLIQHYEAWGLWDDEDCWAEAARLKGDEDICVAMADVVPKDATLKKYKEAVDRTYKLPFRKITISSWLKRLMEKHFGEQVEGPIINGINTAIFYPDPSGAAREGPTVLMPYRRFKNKGHEDGIRAMGIVHEARPDIRIIFFGEKRPEGLPEWISFVENPSDGELRRLYSDADIFTCPSWAEGFGLMPMEASACGSAVAATNVGAIPDYAINGESILATPPRDAPALAAAILKLANDENARRAMAKRGNEYVKQFTWEKATSELEAVFKKYA